MGLYLGLDSSTQSLSALVIDSDAGQVVLQEAVNFGQDLPEYGSPRELLPNPDAQLRHANPLLLGGRARAAFSKLKRNGFDFAAVRGVSGSGQQHGSVYLKTRISDAPAMVERVAAGPISCCARLLGRATAPIWLDSSTTKECAEIASRRRWRCGGRQRSRGSRAIEALQPGRRSASFGRPSQRLTQKRRRSPWSARSWLRS